MASDIFYKHTENCATPLKPLRPNGFPFDGLITPETAPVGDAPARAVEGGGTFAPLALAEHKVGVRGAARARGAGDHVHRVVVIELL